VKLLDEKTMVPIGLAVVAIGGASGWCTLVHFRINALASTTIEVQSKQDKYSQDLAEIRTDLAEIKGELRRLHR
jgi:hypothetical protein